MSQIEPYIAEVLANVFTTAENRNRLESDLRSHFEEGSAVGDNESDLIERMGAAEEVAISFMGQIDLPYAGFGVRILAQLTDFAVMAFAIAPFWVILAIVEMPDSQWFPLMLFSLGWSMAVLFAYPVVLESNFGATVGKHLMGLRVLRETKTRAKLDSIILRNLPLFFDFLLFNTLFVLFTSKKQQAFDMMAKTIVVREQQPRWGWPASFALLATPIVAITIVITVAG